MAVAARPGPSDARVPCPLCGGLLHPIAGKCKHCKADVAPHRAARPAANAPLPALHPAAGSNGHVNGYVGTHAPHPPTAHVVPPLVAAGGASQPVLPPRPAGGSYPTEIEPRASGWRSWPVLVMVLATIAIVAAVVLMVWPAHGGQLDGKRPLTAPPAPERMQTEPDVRPQPQANPQILPKAPQPGATQDPSADPADPPPADPSASANDTDDDDHDANGSIDPYASPHPRAPSVPSNRRRIPINGTGAVWFAIAEHMCRKLDQCGTDDPIGKRACTKISRGAVPSPAGCPAADRCLQHIDTMSCGSMDIGLAQLSVLLNQFRDCTDALGC